MQNHANYANSTVDVSTLDGVLGALTEDTEGV